MLPSPPAPPRQIPAPAIAAPPPPPPCQSPPPPCQPPPRPPCQPPPPRPPCQPPPPPCQPPPPPWPCQPSALAAGAKSRPAATGAAARSFINVRMACTPFNSQVRSWASVMAGMGQEKDGLVVVTARARELDRRPLLAGVRRQVASVSADWRAHPAATAP